MEQLRLPIPTSEDDVDWYATEVLAPGLNRLTDNLGLWADDQKAGILKHLTDPGRHIYPDDFAAAALSLLANEILEPDELERVFSTSSSYRLSRSYWHLAKLHELEELDEEYQPIIESIQDMLLAELEGRGYVGDTPGF